MALTFLTSRLPPEICGVGDHTVRMAEALRTHIGNVTAIHTHGQQPDLDLPFDQIDFWDGRSSSLTSLLQKHETTCLWVQYSGYGFAYQGIPRFLASGLDAVKNCTAIVVYFHQIHCGIRQLGWKGIFISASQRRVAKRIAQQGDLVLTSCELYRHKIQRSYSISSDKLCLLPIGSNIQVPIVNQPDRQRLRAGFGWTPEMKVAVTFGSTESQCKALCQNRQLLVQAIQHGMIHRIACVGGKPGSPPLDTSKICDSSLRPYVIALGYRTPQEVGQALLAADVGLTWYPSHKYGKSGSVMAYAIAGLPLLAPNAVDDPCGAETAASIIRTVSPNDLAQMAGDSGRARRQELAIASVGWQAIVTDALALLQPRGLA